jgi:hypothetical protein
MTLPFAKKRDVFSNPNDGIAAGGLLHCGILTRFRSPWGHKPRRRLGPGASLCPQYLQSRRSFVHRSERRQVPKAAVSRCSKTVFLLDDLVGGHLHDQRHREAECLRRFEIDDEFDLGRLHYRKLGGLLTLEDAIHIEGRLAELVF